MPKKFTSDEVEAAIRRAFQNAGLDPELGVAIGKQESGLRYGLENRTGGDEARGGAYGPMQMTLQTARGLGFKGSAQELHDPDTNAQLAARLVSQLSAQHKDVRDVVSAYNSGSPYAKAGQFTRETYVPGVMKNLQGGFSPDPPPADSAPTSLTPGVESPAQTAVKMANPGLPGPDPNPDPSTSFLDVPGLHLVPPEPEESLGAIVTRLNQQDATETDSLNQHAAWRAANTQVDPAKARQIGLYAGMTGLSSQYIADNLKDIEATFKEGEIANSLATRPELAKFMQDPEKGPLIKDDLKSLGWLEWLFTGKYEHIPAPDVEPYYDPTTGYPMTSGGEYRQITPSVWDVAWAKQRQNILDIKRLRGTSTPQEDAEADTIEKEYGNRDLVGVQQGSGVWPWVRHQVAQMMAGTVKMTPYLMGAAAAGVAGGAAGTATGATIGAVAAGPGGFLAGSAIGAAAGVAGAEVAFNYQQQLGEMYRSFRKMRKADGLTPLLSDTEAKNYAIAASMATSAVMSIPGMQLIKSVPMVERTLQRIAGDAIKEALAKRSFSQATRDLMATWTKQEIVGGLVMASQSGLTAAAQEVAKGTHGEDWHTGNVAEATVNGFAAGMRDLAVLNAWAPAAQWRKDMGMAALTRHYSSEVKAKIKAAADSKTIKDNPEIANEILNKVDTSGEIWRIDRQAWDKIWQSKGQDPREAASRFFEDGGAAYDATLAEGGMMKVPAQKYIVNLSQSEVGLALADDIAAPDQPQTVNQAIEQQKALQKLIDNPPEELKEGHAKIIARETEKMIKSGADEQVAKDFGQVYGNFVLSLKLRDPSGHSLAEWDRHALGIVTPTRPTGGIHLDANPTVLSQRLLDRSVAQLAWETAERVPNTQDAKSEMITTLKQRISEAETIKKNYENTNKGWVAEAYAQDIANYKMLQDHLSMLKPADIQRILEHRIDTPEGGEFTVDQKAYHGTPVDQPFANFDKKFWLTGEGAAAFGKGHYLAEQIGVAKTYRSRLAGAPDIAINGRGAQYHAEGSPARSVIEDLQFIHLGNPAITMEKAMGQLKDKLTREIEYRYNFIQDLEAKRELIFGKRQPPSLAGYRREILKIQAERQGMLAELRYLQKLKAENIDVQQKGALVTAEVPEKTEMINYDALVKDQPPSVLKKLEKAGIVDEAMRFAKENWDRELPGEPELTGADLYYAAGRVAVGKLKKIWADADVLADKDAEASMFLNAIGIPGMHYLDEYSRDEGQGTSNFVVWNDEAIKIIDVLRQGERGSLTFNLPEAPGETLRANMTLFTGADNTTPFHEQAHFFIEALSRMVESPLNHPALEADFQGLMNYMGYKDGAQRRAQQKERIRLMSLPKRNRIEEGQLKQLSAKEEKLAYAWERYLADGKAPSAELLPAFRRFKGWAIQVYKTVLGIDELYKKLYGKDLGLNPEVRSIFDRLISVDEAVSKVDPEPKAEAPLPDVVKNAMTPAEQAKHKELGQTRREKAKEELAATVSPGNARRKEAAQKAAAADAREQAVNDIGNQPKYRALDAITEGKTKISKAAVTREFGKEAVDVLPPGIFGIKGLTPDEMATMLGYENGSMLLDDLSKTDTRAQEVDARTAELRAQDAKPITEDPKEMEAAAIDAVNNDEKARQTALERTALNRAATVRDRKPMMTLDVTEKAAEKMIEALPIEKIQPHLFNISERSAANSAFDAATAGKAGVARDFKDAQILNMYLGRVARKVKEEMDGLLKNLEEFKNLKLRQAIAKSHPTFIRAVDSILEALGMRDANPQAPRMTTLDEYRLLAESHYQETPQTAAILVDPILAKPKMWKELRPDEARAALDMINNIKTNAEHFMEVKTEAGMKKNDALLAAMREETAARPSKGGQPVDLASLSRWQRAGRAPIESFAAVLKKPELLTQMLGKTFHRVIFEDGYLKARDLEQKILKDLTTAFDASFEKLPKGLDRFEVLKLADLPIPKDSGLNPNSTTTRQWLWMVALNMGTQQNRDHLTKSMGWNERDVLRTINNRLTPEEKQFIQGIWDIFGTKIKPLIDAKNQRKLGVAPEPHAAVPLRDENGAKFMEGGFFPTRFDRRPGVSRPGADPELYDRDYIRATKTGETGYSRIPNLQWEVVPGYIAQITHDLAFDEFVGSAMRFMTREDVKKVMVDKIGNEATQQLLEWARVVNNENAHGVAASMQKTFKIFNAARGVLVYSAIGYSIPTAIANLSDIGVAWLSGATGNTLDLTRAFLVTANPFLYGKTRDWALENSMELRNRRENWTREMRDMIGDIGPQGKRSYIGKGLEAVRTHAFFMMEAIDRFSSTMIWTSRYNQELRRTSPDEAARIADHMVRSSMQSNVAAQQSALIRDRGFIGMSLMYHGYFNNVLNRVMELKELNYMKHMEDESPTRMLSHVGRTGALIGRVAGMMMFSNVIGSVLAGRGRDYNEDWYSWIMRKWLAAPFEMFPHASHFGEIIADKLVTGKIRKNQASVQGGSLVALGDNVLNTLGKIFQNNRQTQDKVYDIAETLVAFSSALPAHQMRRTLGFLTDQASDRSSTRLMSLDELSGLLYGEHRKQSKNPLTGLEEVLQ